MMINLNKTAGNEKAATTPDLQPSVGVNGGASGDQPTSPVTTGGDKDDHGSSVVEKPNDNNNGGTFSNRNSSYSRFILKDGEPYLDAMPGVELDRDALISSAAEVIAQLEDPKKVDAFTKSVCRALKCATTDISRSANSKDDAVAAIAVAASSAPTFARRSTLWKDDVKVEDEEDETQKKVVESRSESSDDDEEDIYADKET